MGSAHATQVTWLGHATVLIETGAGSRILIDPFMAHNPKYPKDFQLKGKIDFILLTHGHEDHIADVVDVAADHDSTVIAIYELADYVAGKGVKKTQGMNLGGTAQLADVAATMVRRSTLPEQATRMELTMWVSRQVTF